MDIWQEFIRAFCSDTRHSSAMAVLLRQTARIQVKGIGARPRSLREMAR